MPGIQATYDPNSRAINEVGDQERQQRKAYIDLRWRYYDGDHHHWLKVNPGERDDNITINLCQRAVDKVVEFVGIPQTIELPGGTDNVPGAPGAGLTAQTTPEQAALDALWQAHQYDVPELVESGLVSGHTFLKLYRDVEGRAAMTLLDPRHVTVFWDATNARQVLFFRLQWLTGDAGYRQDIVPDWLLTESEADNYRPQAWWIIDYAEVRGAGWKEVRRETWPHPFPPIVHWPNKKRAHQFYGVSELHDAVSLNDAVNFVASNTGRIIKFHAHPRTIAKGVPPDQIKATSIDGLFSVPENTDVFNLEMQSDLSSSMAMFAQLKSEFFAGRRVLDLSTVRDRLGQITNFGVRMLFSEMIELRDEKTRLIGGGLSAAFQCLLAMDGIEAGPPLVKWGEALPVNRVEALQAAALEKELGTASVQTLSEDLGRDFIAEQERKREEATGAGQMLASVFDTIALSGGLN